MFFTLSAVEWKETGGGGVDVMSFSERGWRLILSKSIVRPEVEIICKTEQENPQELVVAK